MGRLSASMVTVLVVGASYFVWDKLLKPFAYDKYIPSSEGAVGLAQDYGSYIIPALIGLAFAWFMLRRLKQA